MASALFGLAIRLTWEKWLALFVGYISLAAPWYIAEVPVGTHASMGGVAEEDSVSGETAVWWCERDQGALLTTRAKGIRTDTVLIAEYGVCKQYTDLAGNI